MIQPTAVSSAGPESAVLQRAYIGLGANLGDAQASVAAALAALAALPGCRLQQVSPHYRAAPVQAGGPDFVNAVAALDTTLTPHELLAALQRIELDFGRQRSYRNAPRTLDLDLLLYADLELHASDLVLPHPRLHERAFALRPLLDIAPGLAAPGLGPLADWLPGCADQRIDRLPAP